MEQAKIGQFLQPKCEGFLGIVEGLGVQLQREFEFATPVGAGGAKGLQVGRYGGWSVASTSRAQRWGEKK